MEPLPSFIDECNESMRYEGLFSSEVLTSVARCTGFIKRLRKLNAMVFVHLCTFTQSFRSYPSLEEMRGELIRLWGIRMSKSSLYTRFTPEAVSFIRRVFQSVVHQGLSQGSVLEFPYRFSDVILFDSTVLNLDPKCASIFRGSGGGASASSSKLQLNLGLLSGRLWELSLLEGAKGDPAYRLSEIQAKALYIFDLGYLCAQNLRQIITHQAWFLTRYRYRMCLFRPDGRPISQRALNRLVRLLPQGAYFDIEVLLTREGKIPCRLILHKLPKPIADQIRRKLKTDKQKKIKNLSEDRLAFCDVNAYITNLSVEQMPPELTRKAYSLRWQIEILFKAWKSYLKMDQTRNLGPFQFQCCLYGTLIRMIIGFRIFQQAKQIYWKYAQIEISELKALALMATYKNEWAKWLIIKEVDPKVLFEQIGRVLFLTCRKETKYKELSPWQIMHQFP